jgi:hypothetical protein
MSVYHLYHHETNSISTELNDKTQLKIKIWFKVCMQSVFNTQHQFRLLTCVILLRCMVRHSQINVLPSEKNSKLQKSATNNKSNDSLRYYTSIPNEISVRIRFNSKLEFFKSRGKKKFMLNFATFQSFVYASFFCFN